MQGNRTWARWTLPLVFIALSTGGCVAAAAAGAGAGGGYYFTSRGVGSTISKPVDTVAAHAQAVLADEGITITEQNTKAEGDTREFKGKKGDLDISVELKRNGDNETKAEVSARKNLVEWDKDYAQKLMDKIVKAT